MGDNSKMEGPHRASSSSDLDHHPGTRGLHVLSATGPNSATLNVVARTSAPVVEVKLKDNAAQKR